LHEAKLQQTLWKSKIISRNTEFDALMGIYKLGRFLFFLFRDDKTGSQQPIDKATLIKLLK
jgi:hypothetical protein